MKSNPKLKCSVWVAVVLSTLFVTAYVGSLTLEGRRMQDALDARR